MSAYAAYGSGYDAGGGYTTIFPRPTPADRIFYGNSSYEARSYGYDPGYGDIYYRGYGSRGSSPEQYYYSITKYSSDGNYYHHYTGRVSYPANGTYHPFDGASPAFGIAHAYSNDLYVNGDTSDYTRTDYSDRHTDGFSEYTTTRQYTDYNSDGSIYRSYQHTYSSSDAGATSKYTTFSSEFTNSQGMSYYYSGHS